MTETFSHVIKTDGQIILLCYVKQWLTAEKISLEIEKQNPQWKKLSRDKRATKVHSIVSYPSKLYQAGLLKRKQAGGRNDPYVYAISDKGIAYLNEALGAVAGMVEFLVSEEFDA